MAATSNSQDGIAKRAVRGTFWSFLSFFSGRVLTFVTTLVLARLLVPAEFGIIAYCTIVITYLDLLNNLGVGHALIARRDKLEEAQNAAFLVSIGTAIVLYAGTWLVAPLIADFFNEPQVVPLLRVLTLGLLLVGIGSTPMAMLQRELRFKALILPDILRNVVKALVAIGMAWQGFGVWSLVVSELVSKVIETAVAWAVLRWRPTRAFDRQVLREMIGYGVNITGVGLIGAFMVNVDYFLVGRLLGAAALGYYMMAFRIPELVIRSVSQIVSRVAFPVLARAQNQEGGVNGVYFVYLRYMALFTFPAGVGLALLAAPFVDVFYQDVWAPMIQPMQLVSIASGFSVISYLAGVIYNSIGRPELTRRLQLVKLPVVIAVLYAGTFWGITGVAAAHIVLTLLSTVLDLVVMRRVLSIRLGDVMAALQPALISTAAMAVVTSGCGIALAESGLVALLLLPLIGGGVYLGTLWLVGRETLVQARTVLRGSFARG